MTTLSHYPGLPATGARVKFTRTLVPVNTIQLQFIEFPFGRILAVLSEVLQTERRTRSLNSRPPKLDWTVKYEQLPGLVGPLARGCAVNQTSA